MALFRMQLVLVAVQLLLGLWARFLPQRKIADPAKKLMTGCCYYSRRAAASQEAWDFAQARFSRWCLLLALPSALVSFLTARLLAALSPSGGLLPALLALAVPLLFLLACRLLTEQDLKRRPEP